MEQRRKRAVSLGIRIGLVFLLAMAAVLLSAYFVVSRSFHQLLTDYSIKLVQSMVSQGVSIVENELETSFREAVQCASALTVPPPGSREADFPLQSISGERVLRMVYVSDAGSIASDGRQRDVRERSDIQAAFQGETALHGPCFDEDGQYLVCYTAPVVRDGRVVGVLSIEKDGYLFCDLIRNIRFVDSGESYLINAQGTDIAVSDPNHIDWVNSQYNGRRILEQGEDPVTRSIVDLEQKGLDGETGVGTYLWNDGLVYVIYEPIPSSGWVLLGGMREEEIAAMTRSALLDSISQGPALKISFAVFFLLVGVIIFWIITSMKRDAEINAKLEIIANHDALTGLLNRRFLETSLSEQWKYPVRVSGQAAIYMADIDDFKQYNDRYGHPQGDDCLRTVANIFQKMFDGKDCHVIRYGGEEFLAVAFLISRQGALEKGQELCRRVEQEHLPNGDDRFVTISVGISHVDLTCVSSLADCIRSADEALYQAKQNGKNQVVLVDVPPTKPG